MRNAHHTYALSSQVQWECEQVYKIHPKILKAGLSKNILSKRIKLYNNNSKDKSIINFVTLSRLVRKKNVDIVIKSLQDIKLPKKWHLTVLGAGEDSNRLKKIALDLGLRRNVTFTGRVSDAILHQNLLSSDVFITMDTSDFEITVVEAMSFGLFVVVSDNFDMDSNFIDYQSICSVKPDKEILKIFLEKKMLSMLDNKPNFKPLENLTWEHYFSSIIKDIK